MKFAVALAALFVCAEAFAPAFTGRSVTTRVNNFSEDIGIECGEECGMEKYPNMPESVHAGVVTGQALVDLLDHAKENGKLGINQSINDQMNQSINQSMKQATRAQDSISVPPSMPSTRNLAYCRRYLHAYCRKCRNASNVSVAQLLQLLQHAAHKKVLRCPWSLLTSEGFSIFSSTFFLLRGLCDFYCTLFIEVEHRLRRWGVLSHVCFVNTCACDTK